jgi:hypothetical protein
MGIYSLVSDDANEIARRWSRGMGLRSPGANIENPSGEMQGGHSSASRRQEGIKEARYNRQGGETVRA